MNDTDKEGHGSIEPRLLANLTKRLDQDSSMMPTSLKNLIQLTQLCSLADIENRDPSATTNWMENALLEQSGYVGSTAHIGQAILKMEVSPVQGVMEWENLPNEQQEKLAQLCAKDTLPSALRNVLTYNVQGGKPRIEVNLLAIGVSKLRLTEGLAREITRALDFGKIDKLTWSPNSSDTSELGVKKNWQSLRPDIRFVVPPGDEPMPSWTVAERGLVESATKSGTAVMTIFEPSGKGKTYLARHLIKNVAYENIEAYMGSGNTWVYQRVIEKLRNNYYPSLSRLDDLVVVTPQSTDKELDLATVFSDFEKLMVARQGQGPVVLVIDNAHDRHFPTDGKWLNQIEKLKNMLTHRHDGSGIFILGEREPEGLNVSQEQEHRIGRVHLPFTQEDLGLDSAQVKSFVVNESAPGFVLVREQISRDPQSKTLYKVRDMVKGKSGEDLPYDFNTRYQASRDALVTKITTSLILSDSVRKMFLKNPEISRFLSRSHLAEAGKHLNAQLISALEDTTGRSWVTVKKDGTFTINNNKLTALIKAESDNLVRVVTELSTGKEREYAGAIVTDSAAKELSLSVSEVLTDVSLVIEDLKREEGELKERLEGVTKSRESLESAWMSLSTVEPEDLKAVLSSRGLIQLVQKILGGSPISDEEWQGIDKTHAVELLTVVARTEGLESGQSDALKQLASLMTVADTLAKWTTVETVAKNLAQPLKQQELFAKSTKIISAWEDIVERMKSI